MADVITKASAQAYFETGDKPTQSEFEDLIASTVFLPAGTSAATAGGLVKVSGVNDSSFIESGTVGEQIIGASTTSQALGIIGLDSSLEDVVVGAFGKSFVSATTTAIGLERLALGIPGAVGLEVLSAITTASATNHLGIGTIAEHSTFGAALASAASTAAGQLVLGGGTVGISIYEAATTAAVKAITGGVVQEVNVQDGAVSTGTTRIPLDDSIPQITEGDEVMTLAVTPTSSTNNLKIEVVVAMADSANAFQTVALFQDSTANAIASMQSSAQGNNAPNNVKFTHYMAAGTTSSTTFKVRIGAANAATTTFNGDSGGRNFGGTMASSITITEISV